VKEGGKRGFLFGLFSDPEDGGDMRLSTDYMA
jgi:hypothetical protein